MKKSNRNSKKKTSNKDFKLVTKKQVQDMFRTRASATNNYTDTSLTVSTINTHYVINLPVVGDASNSLSGQKFTLDKITVRLVMYANTIATTIPQICRFVVYQATPPSYASSPITTAELLDDTGSTINDVQSLISFENSGKLFHVLHDARPVLNAFDRSSHQLVWELKPKIHDMVYDTSNANNQYASGGIFIYAQNLNTAAAAFGAATTHNCYVYVRAHWHENV